MDNNAADQRPRAPLIQRVAYVCCAIAYFVVSVCLVDIAYSLFGTWGAACALGVVFLSSLVVLVIRDVLLSCCVRRPRIAAVGAGGGVAGDDGGGMDVGEISALTAAFTFRRDIRAAEGWAECSICLGLVREGESVRRLPACGHLFHAGCVDEWLHEHPTCPLCRAAIRAAGRPSEQLLPV